MAADSPWPEIRSGPVLTERASRVARFPHSVYVGRLSPRPLAEP